MNSAERYCKNIPSQKISRSNSIKRMGSMKKIERDSNGSFGKSKGS